MTDLNKEELRRLALSAKSNGDWFAGGCSLYSYYKKSDADFVVSASPGAILALLDELAAIKASGWRNHSVNYAKGESCPKTLETAQAAWDRDQELIEDQRQQVAKDSQTINQLRQENASLRSRNTGLLAQHGRDSVEPRNLCQQRDNARRARCGGPGICEVCSRDVVVKDGSDD